ncbi:MAG TPA: sterol desaturase family protein [Kofleriaceae bacterium]|nr:sterol desaturase family protein [Kofleriaceae bacterium]
MSNLVLYSIPAFIVLMTLEILYTRTHLSPKVLGYERADTRTSLLLGICNVAINGVTKLASIPLFAVVYEHRLANLGQPDQLWSWLVLLFAEDNCYYWFHRLHHEVRFLWAAHVPHHSSERFNLSTALRQPLLTPITGPLFWVPLAVVGYPPVMILTAQAWSLLYQFWIHTETIDRLGPLEWIMNTPSHHRVHHGANVEYLDRNHAGIFIIWDRLFGTFEREDARVIYGLTKNVHTFHLAKVGFHDVVAMARDVVRAPTLRAKLGYMFAPPGWSHDGSSHTASQLRALLGKSAAVVHTERPLD